MPPNRPLRVAILGCRGYPSTYGGFETFVRRLAPYLRDDGMDVSVYCREPTRKVVVRTVDDITCIDTWGVDSKSASTLSYGLTSAVDSLRRRYDSVLVLNVANGYFLPLLEWGGTPVALNVDGIEWERAKWSPTGKAVFKAGAWLSAKLASRIVVDSTVIGDIWRDQFGVPSTFLPYGADVVTDTRTDKVKALGIEPGSYLLVVARLAPENNVELLLDALDQRGWPYPTVIVGSANYDNPIEARLNAITAANPQVRWLGHVHDQELLAQLWSSCALYWHGHSVGGTNPALLQALGAGAPTLALDTAFNREVLGGGDQTVPADPAVLATRIEALMADPVQRAALSASGRATISERYQWADVCRGYADLLRELAAARAAKRRR